MINGKIKSSANLSGSVRLTADTPTQEVFWATYGATTFAEVTQALADGKVCLVNRANGVYYLANYSTTAYHFYRLTEDGTTGDGVLGHVDLYDDVGWQSYVSRLQSKLTYDTEPKQWSNNPVRSYGIWNAIHNITVNVDNALSDTSENAVQNKVITQALAGKADVAALQTIVDDWLDANIGSIGTLSYQAKRAILNCFSKVAWVDDQGQTYYDALENALFPPAALESITAAFVQEEHTIYDTDSLDTLRQYLTVTAHYDNGTSAAVSDYELSGTLTAGTSTIAVSYGGKSDTFNVTVTSAILYQVKNHSVTASSGYIDTDVQLLKTDRDFSIVFDGTQAGAIATGRGIRIFFCANASTSWKGIMFGAGSSSAQYTFQWYSHTSDYVGFYRNADGTRWRVVYVHEAGSDSATIYYKIGNDAVASFTLSNEFIAQESHFLIGGADEDQSTNWVGTIAECTVYGIKLSQSEINTFLS